MVDPNFFGHGIAQKMIGFIESQYSYCAITLGKYELASSFYLKNGFLVARTVTIAGGVCLSHLERNEDSTMSNLVVRTVEDLREHFEQQAMHDAEACPLCEALSLAIASDPGLLV